MNTFINNLNTISNFEKTENGALAHKTTGYNVYDMFATGGAYRKRSDLDCIFLFKKAFEENPTLAMKCLFYLRDCRGGQGERRFFRTCFRWLAKTHKETALKNLKNISEYGRWDDLIYTCIDTSIEEDMLKMIKEQLELDYDCKTPSLLAKWLPSENASSQKTKYAAKKIIKSLGCTSRQYRKMLSILRARINVLERLMSSNRWDEIEFDKIPSKAGLIYKNAFARRDIIAKKYETFAKSETTKVNAKTLYPYEIVNKAIHTADFWGYNFTPINEVDRAMIEKYWNNQIDYLNGADCKIMCVIDTSGSMTGSTADAPINIALSLGMYCVERLSGPFKDCFITFSSRPRFIKFEGVDFVDKVRRVYARNECSNTDLIKTFELLLTTCRHANKEDIPETIVVISDMQIDSGSYFYKGDVKTEMEKMRQKWESFGLKMPKLVYWNVRASANGGAFLDDGPNVTYVSGASPTIFKQVLTGKTGIQLMLDILLTERYENIVA